MSQINEQSNMISGSFSDIESLKTNAQQMVQNFNIKLSTDRPSSTIKN